MSIWKKNSDPPELEDYTYKKTIIGLSDGMFDKCAAWVEGADFKWEELKVGDGFGIAGGNIGTNSGLKLNKKQLQYILDNMNEQSELRFCGCNHLDEESFRNEAIEYNKYVKTGVNSFAPPKKII